MTDPLLKTCLQPLVHRHRRLRLWRRMTLGWGVAIGVGLVVLGLQRLLGWSPMTTVLGLTIFGAGMVLWVAYRHRGWAPDLRALATGIEHQHPELEGRVLTAVQQEAGASGELSYLQDRLLNEVFQHASRSRWKETLPSSRLVLAQAGHWMVFALFGLVVWGLTTGKGTVGARRLAWLIPGVEVTPGDTELERGNSLVVMAQFGGAVPSSVELVLTPTQGTASRVPLVRGLDQRLFGGTVPDVKVDLSYRVEYGDRATREFKVSVFEYPRLEKSDAELTFPEYSGEAPKRIEDTRRLSALEGSDLDLNLALNKPVARARLVAKDRTADSLELEVDPDRPAARLKDFQFQTSGRYDLELVDAQGRTNKAQALFVFDVLTNRLPELRLASPRGDQRPSAIEEITFAGTVWDDFGVLGYGLAWSKAGEEPTWLELGKESAGREKREFQHVLRLEDVGVSPDDLLIWHLWADDLGPDGERRRTSGDLFFGEVRPFEEIFREGEQQAGGGQPPGQQGQQQGSPTTQLTELQKQIINATWKLQRERGRRPRADAAKDLEVVRDSQMQAIEQAESAAAGSEDPRGAALWDRVTEAMEGALGHLNDSLKERDALPNALSSEQEAYQALLRLQQREFAVQRGQNQPGQGGGGQQQRQRQLDQLDLRQSENRYETESQASAPQEQQRSEQLQVLNRLQELARRQEGVNERLQELQTALQEARTEAEREEIRRQLKRLQEEEQRLLADVDELRQRMDRPENQSSMSEERQQLDQTREDVRRAAEAAAEGAVSQALASGTRAQRQLQEMRDSMRQESSSAFAEDLRRMRTEARELSRRQEGIREDLDELATNPRRVLNDDAEREQVLRELQEQEKRLSSLVDDTTRVSQEAEVAEPLVSDALYDTLRRFTQEDLANVREMREELLESGMMTRSLYERLENEAEDGKARAVVLTAELLRRGYLPQADQAEDRARAGIEDLRRGVERAAQSVLGDDTEALRRAREQLDEVTRALEREIAEAAQGEGSTTSPQSQGQGQRGEQPGTPGSRSENQSPDPQPGEQARRGQGAGRNTEAGQESETAQAGQQGEGQQGAGQQGEGQQGGGQQEGSPTDTAQNRGEGRRGNQGGDQGGLDLDRLLGGGGGGGGRGGPWTGPLTGDDFGPWSDRLREVEELVDVPDLRTQVATARERARDIRREFTRDLRKPDWAQVRLSVVRPLVEVRKLITEALARRESNDPLVPIDRDPVPGRYSELVRRYYEELGRSQP